MLGVTEVLCRKRRTELEIKADRASLERLLRTSQYREMGTDYDRVLSLRSEEGCTLDDISAVIRMPKSTVSEWCNGKIVAGRMGRPPYLHPEDHSTLFQEIIPARAAEHKCMTNKHIVNEVYRHLNHKII